MDFIDRGQGQADLRKFIGGNILPMGGETEEQDPFCGEVPDDAVGYAQYRRFYEAKMQTMVGQMGTLKQLMNCEALDEQGRMVRVNGQLPGHEFAGIVIACPHVIHQDPVSPEGIYFRPFTRGSTNGIFICKTCFRLDERHRLNYGLHLSMKCDVCVGQSLERVAALFPDRVVNLLDK
jgi:hypothetical protein